MYFKIRLLVFQLRKTAKEVTFSFHKITSSNFASPMHYPPFFKSHTFSLNAEILCYLELFDHLSPSLSQIILFNSVYLFCTQKYVLKPNDELDAVLGTGHRIINKTDKIPKSRALTLLYCRSAWCPWKTAMIKKSSDSFVFQKGLSQGTIHSHMTCV